MGVDVLAFARPTENEDASFAAVFNEHHRPAVRLAYLLTGDAFQAEDIVSEAFAKVYVQWRKGRVEDVGPYLRRAVANQANSKLRRRYLERREASRRTGDERGVRTIDDQAADHDVVWHAIQQLPDRQRQVVVLRYYEDLSEADTADVLGISTGTVKSSLSRGLERLEQLLATESPQSSQGGGR
jgi:RNA polymerase sigma-70 factor (sigma-E family)